MSTSRHSAGDYRSRKQDYDDRYDRHDRDAPRYQRSSSPPRGYDTRDGITRPGLSISSFESLLIRAC
jgi:hypothetical protein